MIIFGHKIYVDWRNVLLDEFELQVGVYVGYFETSVSVEVNDCISLPQQNSSRPVSNWAKCAEFYHL